MQKKKKKKSVFLALLLIPSVAPPPLSFIPSLSFLSLLPLSLISFSSYFLLPLIPLLFQDCLLGNLTMTTDNQHAHVYAQRYTFTPVCELLASESGNT